MIPDLSKAAWRKSSYSGGENGNCVEMALVEVASVGTATAVRDSKNPAGAVLVFGQAPMVKFLRSAKAGLLG